MRNALERCDQKSNKWAAKNPALASAKARAWYKIGVALPPITAAVVAEVLPYRCVISNYRRVYDCTKFVFEGSPYHHPGGSSNIIEGARERCGAVLRHLRAQFRRQIKRGVLRAGLRLTSLFPHTMTAHRLMRKDMLAWDGPLHAGAPSLAGLCVDARAAAATPRDRGIFISILARPPHLRSIVGDAVPRREPLDLGDRSES